MTSVGHTRARAASHHESDGAEKINVRRVFDFESFESETLRKNRLAVTRRHKVVASTQFLLCCKSRSGDLHRRPGRPAV